MLSKILGQKQIFITVILFFLFLTGILGVLTNYTLNLWQGISLSLLCFTAILSITFAREILFLKKTQYFSFFLLGWLFTFTSNLNDLSFFAGMFFLYVIFLSLQSSDYFGNEFLSPFDLGFFSGVAVILHPPLWIFTVFLIVHYILISRTQPRNLLSVLIGLLTIIILGFELLLLTDNWSLMNEWKQGFAFSFYSFHPKMFYLIPIGLMLLIAVTDYSRHLIKKSPHKKQLFFNTLLFGLFSLIYIFLYSGKETNSITLLAFPVALLFSNFVIYEKNSLRKELFLGGFIVFLTLFTLNPSFNMPEFLKNIKF